MKKIILPIIFIISLSNVFAQVIVIYPNSGTKTILQTNKIDSIVVFTCDTTPVIYRGKTYHVIQIGTQCWLQENLNAGRMIDSSSDQINNSGRPIIEKYCYNNDTNNCNIYGGLYQWAEAVQYANGATNTSLTNPRLLGKIQGICPTGWHIPSKTDFNNLTSVAGANALKAIGQGSGSGRGTNTSGFSALLAGWLNSWYPTLKGRFVELGISTNFWSSTEESEPDTADILYLDSSNSRPLGQTEFKVIGSSVRCVKD